MHLSINVNHGRQQERQCLPRPCRRDPNHVPAQQRHGPSLALDRGGRVKSLLHNLLQHVFGHGRLFKCKHRLRDPMPLHGNAMLRPPACRLGLLSFRHVGVLDVKVFLEGREFIQVPVYASQTRTQTAHTITTPTAATKAAAATTVAAPAAPAVAIDFVRKREGNMRASVGEENES